MMPPAWHGADPSGTMLQDRACPAPIVPMPPPLLRLLELGFV